MNADTHGDDEHLREAFFVRLFRLSPGFPVTRGLVAINVVVFLLMCLAGADPLQPGGRVAVAWGSNFGPLTLGGQWWRLLSSVFIHFGLLHLAVNMWSLYQTGALVERLFGSGRFLMLYLLAGLAGSLASLVWNPLVNSAGASGAIFGVIGGLLVFLFDQRQGVPRVIAVDVRKTTLFFVAFNLINGFTHAGIDNAAHLGGLVGGTLAGLMLARSLAERERAAGP
jgi:rhomboid protease GluP